MAQPRDIPPGRPSQEVTAAPKALNSSQPAPVLSTRHPHNLSLNTFQQSPVTQNGCYDFDRVLKSGLVKKRTRKTKSWKPIYLVLRPTSISIYKDQRETRLRHKIQLADLTAVANLKDPKGKRENLFGLYSPSRNYHLEALSKEDAAQWVGLIRGAARIEEAEEEMFLASPSMNTPANPTGIDEAMRVRMGNMHLHEERLSSSPEPIDTVGRPQNAPLQGTFRRPSHFDYSGNEPASQSDMSDGEAQIHRAHGGISQLSIPEDGPLPRPSFGGRNTSQMFGFSPTDDPERVVWQGHLLWLKSKSGMRQWKNLWAVLRARSFALYKNEEEYSPVLVISMDAILNAVEIDPISKTKKHCLQIITEERSYRFCAMHEENLDRALGGFKSLLAKRRPEQRGAAVDISL